MCNPGQDYIDGYTSDGGIGLAPTTGGYHSGTHWLPLKVYESDNIYAFYCLGTGVNSDYIYLQADISGSVGLGSQVGVTALWRVTYEGNDVITLTNIIGRYLTVTGGVELTYTPTRFRFQEVSFP